MSVTGTYDSVDITVPDSAHKGTVAWIFNATEILGAYQEQYCIFEYKLEVYL